MCTCRLLQSNDHPADNLNVMYIYQRLSGFHLQHKRRLDEVNLDEQGQLFGIPNARFKDLVDSTGTTIPPEVGYQVYSLFIYYHSYCTGLTEPVTRGKGIHNLKKIGNPGSEGHGSHPSQRDNSLSFDLGSICFGDDGVNKLGAF